MNNHSVRNNIEEMVLEIVGDHMGIPAPALSLTDHIIEDLGADSLDQMELIMTVEELFGIKITDRNIADIVKIADIVSAIEGTSLSSSHLAQARDVWKMVSSKKI